MYNTENQIDNETKTKKPNTTGETLPDKALEALYQKGLLNLAKNEVEEALHCFWSAVDFGYSRALIPTIFLEIGSDLSGEQSRSLREVMKLIELGCTKNDEAALLILAHWNMNWSVYGDGIKYIDMDTFALRRSERKLYPIDTEDIPELQVMSLSRLDHMISSFSLRVSTMGYLNDQVNTGYAIRLLMQLIEAQGRKAIVAEKYLYYLLTDNYELWIDKLLPRLCKESQRGNEYAKRLLSRINYHSQYLPKVKKLISWMRG